MGVVETERNGRVATVTLNRPEAKNSMSPELVVRLAAAWDELRDDGDVWVVVLTGAPGSTFCGGADLRRMAPLMTGARAPEDEWDRTVLADPGIIGRSVLCGVDLGKPVIVAANGHAVGGGMIMVMGGDLRIMAKGATMSLTEVKLGLLTEGGGTVFLGRELPPALARELSFTGSPLSAERACETGFLNYVVDQSEVLPLAQEIAATIAGNAPLAVRAARRVMRATFGMNDADALELERQTAAQMFETEDAREGPRAYLEKRTPSFLGR